METTCAVKRNLSKRNKKKHVASDEKNGEKEEKDYSEELVSCDINMIDLKPSFFLMPNVSRIII